MNVNFCKNFVVLRKMHGYTQETIAEKCGVSRQAIAKWETGASLPDMYKLVDIAKLFDVSIDDLVCGECYSLLCDFSPINEKIEQVLSKVTHIETKLAEDESCDLYQYYCQQLSEDPGEREVWSYILTEHLDIADEYRKSGYERAWDIIESLIALGEGTFYPILDNVSELYSLLYDEYVPSGSQESAKLLDFVEDFANILPAWSKILKHEVMLERQKPNRFTDWPEE